MAEPVRSPAKSIQVFLPSDQSAADTVARLQALPECAIQTRPFEGKATDTPALFYDKNSWQLMLPGGAQCKVDFLEPVFVRRLQAANIYAEHLVKAVLGRKKRSERPTVLDATAGLGRESMLLAAAGCQVTLIERVPLLGFLLEQALAAARDTALGEVADASARANLLVGNSVQLMRDWAGPPPDIVYLDPMYADREQPGTRGLKPSAAVKKNMQALQLLDDIYHANYDRQLTTGNDELFAQALQLATQKLVVKRAPKAPWLNAKKPASSIEGKAARFDIYVI